MCSYLNLLGQKTDERGQIGTSSLPTSPTQIPLRYPYSDTLRPACLLYEYSDYYYYGYSYSKKYLYSYWDDNPTRHVWSADGTCSAKYSDYTPPR